MGAFLSAERTEIWGGGDPAQKCPGTSRLGEKHRLSFVLLFNTTLEANIRRGEVGIIPGVHTLGSAQSGSSHLCNRDGLSWLITLVA